MLKWRCRCCSRPMRRVPRRWPTSSSSSMSGGARCRRWRSTPLDCWPRRSPGEAPLVIRDDAWAPGLLGLVAGRLADDLARPVVAAALVGDEVRGSVRAPVDFHVAAALEACAAHLTKRGGHAAAGGFSALPSSWEAFADAFGALERPLGAGSDVEVQHPGRQLVDLVLPSRYLGWELADELGRLAPYGPGHLEPVLAVTGLRVGSVRRIGARETHISFRMLRGIESRRRDRVRDGRRTLPSRGGRAGRPRRHAGARHVRWHGPPSAARPRLRRCCRQPAARPSNRPRRAGPRRMTAPLERLRARREALGAPLCLGIDPHPDQLPDDLPPERGRSGSLRAGHHRGRRRSRRGGEDQRRLLRGVRRRGLGGARAGATGRAGRCALHPRRQARGHRLDRGTVRGRPVRPPRCRRGDPVAVPRRGRRHSLPGRCRSARLPARPNQQPVGRTTPGAARRWRAAAPVGWRAGPPAPGAMVGSVSWSAPRRRRSWRGSGSTVPGPAFLVPGVGAQGGDLVASARACDGTWAPGLVSVSRGIAVHRVAATGARRPRVRPRSSAVACETRCYTPMPLLLSDPQRRFATRCRFPDRWNSSCCW